MSVKSSLAASRKRATMRQERTDAAPRSLIKKDVAASHSSSRRVLVIDVGGSSVKILATSQTESRSFRSGPTLTPRRMVSRVKKLAADWAYDVVSIGYPGPVLHGRPIAEPHVVPSKSLTTPPCRRWAATRAARCYFWAWERDSAAP